MNVRPTCLAAALAAAAVALASQPAAALPPGSTVLVDRPPGFGALPFDGIGHSEVGPNSLSSDLCFTVFTSGSDVLSAADEDSARNVFRLDLCHGEPTLTQVNTTVAHVPAEPGSESGGATVSTDGRYVAFHSNARNLAPGLSRRQDRVYIKDMDTGALELVSRGDGANGAPAEQARESTISGDGLSVAFVALGALHADNADGVSGDRDVYVRSLPTARTHMVSVTTSGARGGGALDDPPAIDHTGRRVAFVTRNDLDGSDGDGDFDAYVRHQVGAAAEATQRLSTTTAGGVSHVALSGSSTKLALAGDRVWVADCVLLTACGAASPVDEPLPGGTNTGGARDPFFGRPLTAGGAPQAPARVYWRTRSALDPADADGADDIYTRELPPGTGIHLVAGAAADGDVGGADADDNGFVLVFDMQQTLGLPGSDGQTRQVWLNTFGEFTNLSQPFGTAPRTDEAGDGGLGRRHATSRDGRIVAFDSRAPAFGSRRRSAGYASQVLVRDVVSGVTRLVSVAPNGVTAGDEDSFDGGVDAAGRKVVFTSAASNLVPGVGDHAFHVYLRDLATGSTTLVDRTTAGAPAGAEGARISGDGATVVFESSSAGLPESPADGQSHIYRADLAGGRIALVDRSGTGAAGDGSAGQADVSADGSRVVFLSSATNLGGGTQQRRQVYVRDLAAGTTTWASVPEDGDPAHATVFDPSISGDGRRVAFEGEGAAFGYGATDQSQVFVRDLAAGTTTLASRGALGAADTGAFLGSLSADGSKVAFKSAATNLGGQVDDFTAYVRDLAAGTTVPVAVRDGAPAQARSIEGAPVVSGNGACVAFVSTSHDLVDAGYGPDFIHVYLHALTGECAPGAGGSGAGGSGPPASDTAAPRITGLRVTHRRFAVGRRSTPRSAARRPRGTAFLFRLSEDAATTITIARRLPGRRRAGRCVRPRRRSGRRCTRLVTKLRLHRTRTHAGANRVAFSGRVRRRPLHAGRYRAILRAVDPAGNRSAPRSVDLLVVRR